MSFAFEVKHESEFLLPGNGQRIRQARDSHVGKTCPHPRDRIQVAQLFEVALLHITHAIGEALDHAVVIQDKPAVECPSHVDLNHAATA
jgi:hypothetical protein